MISAMVQSKKPDGKAAFTSLTRVLIRFCYIQPNWDYSGASISTRMVLTTILVTPLWHPTIRPCGNADEAIV